MGRRVYSVEQSGELGKDFNIHPPPRQKENIGPEMGFKLRTFLLRA